MHHNGRGRWPIAPTPEPRTPSGRPLKSNTQWDIMTRPAPQMSQFTRAPSTTRRLHRWQAARLAAQQETARITGRTTCATTRAWTHRSAAGSGPSLLPRTPITPLSLPNTVATSGAPRPQLRSYHGSSARNRTGHSADQDWRGPTAQERLSAPHSSPAPAPEGLAAPTAMDTQASASPATETRPWRGSADSPSCLECTPQSAITSCSAAATPLAFPATLPSRGGQWPATPWDSITATLPV